LVQGEGTGERRNAGTEDARTRAAADRPRPQKGPVALHALVEAAVMVALATVLSVVVVYRMPQGGSVTPASMVPLLVLALRRGPGVGFLAGAGFGFIQFALEPYVVHWAQVVLDYPLAFALLGLAGLFPRLPYVGVAVGIAGRLASHVLSGVIFFASYAPAGMNPWVYSLVYNSSYLVPELIISMVVVMLISAGRRGRIIKRVS